MIVLNRVSCKNKSDLDLPRYGKRWSANAMYEPQAKVETKLLSEGEDHTQEVNTVNLFCLLVNFMDLKGFLG